MGLSLNIVLHLIYHIEQKQNEQTKINKARKNLVIGDKILLGYIRKLTEAFRKSKSLKAMLKLIGNVDAERTRIPKIVNEKRKAQFDKMYETILTH